MGNDEVLTQDMSALEMIPTGTIILSLKCLLIKSDFVLILGLESFIHEVDSTAVNIKVKASGRSPT